jgi:hypothetical protein
MGLALFATVIWVQGPVILVSRIFRKTEQLLSDSAFQKPLGPTYIFCPSVRRAYSTVKLDLRVFFLRDFTILISEQSGMIFGRGVNFKIALDLGVGSKVYTRFIILIVSVA